MLTLEIKSLAGGGEYNIKVTTKTGNVFEKSSNDCEYLKALLNGLTIRESCNTCKFAKEQRCGDITLGEFAGITNVCDGVYDQKGTSLIIFNKFTSLTKEIRDYLFTQCNCLKKLRFCNKVEFYNRRLAYPAFCNPSRSSFFSDLNKMSFNEATEINLNPKYHVAILNYWWGNNYGSNLTAYALQRMISILGYTSCLVGFTYDSIENFYRGISDNFSRKYLITTNLLTEESLPKLNEQTDRFIVGSDQVFSNKYMHDSFFLNFVELNKLKIAYSASFGKKRFKCRSKYLNAYKYLLSRFDYVSVRERSGIDACIALGEKDAIHIIDPVFTIDKSEYLDIAKGSCILVKKEYLLVYILDLTKQIADKCKSIAIKMNLECKFIKVGRDSVEDWLNLHINATYIITDSFHGTCFSIIFNKNFICIENLMRGEERFKCIKESLNIPSCCFIQKSSFISGHLELNNKINYTEINETIEKLNKYGWDFLKKVLTCPLPSYSEKDLKDDELKLSNTITPKCTKGKFTIKYFACFDSLLSKENGIAELSIYGAGEICQYLIKYCDYRGIKINQIFDSYPELKNNCIMGRKISRLSEHNLKYGDSLFVASVEFKDQIVGFVKDNIKDLDLKIITLNL